MNRLITTELFAQLGDKYVHCPGMVEIVVAPQVKQGLPTSQYVVSMVV